MKYLLNLTFDSNDGNSGSITMLAAGKNMQEAVELAQKYLYVNQSEEGLKGITKIYLNTIHKVPSGNLFAIICNVVFHDTLTSDITSINPCEDHDSYQPTDYQQDNHVVDSWLELGKDS